MDNAKRKALYEMNTVLGKVMRLHRKERGVSQEYIAGLLGVTYQQYQKLETGKNMIRAVQLFKFCDDLGVPVEAIEEHFFSELDYPRAVPLPKKKELQDRKQRFKEMETHCEELLHNIRLMNLTDVWEPKGGV